MASKTPYISWEFVMWWSEKPLVSSCIDSVPNLNERKFRSVSDTNKSHKSIHNSSLLVN